MVVSSTSMNAAKATKTAISHGLAVPLAALWGTCLGIWPSAAALTGAPSAALEAKELDQPARSARPICQGRRRRRWWVVDRDLHRHPLDDLDEVAGGVLGRKQRERRPGSRLDAGDVAVKGATGIGVDPERGGLARPHLGELRLLEVGVDPDLVRHEHRQAGAGLGELTDRGREIGDASGLGCRYGRVGQVQLRLVALSLSLCETGERAAALGVERVNLPLSDRKRGLRGLESRLLLVQLGVKLLRILHRTRTPLRPRPVARSLLLCEHEVRLRLFHLDLLCVSLRVMYAD